MKKLQIAVTVIFLAVMGWLAFRYVWISSFKRGSEFMSSRDYDRAILYFDKTIKIKQKFAPAYCNRGTCYYEKGQYDWAILDFNKTLEINPNQPQVTKIVKALKDKKWLDYWYFFPFIVREEVCMNATLKNRLLNLCIFMLFLISRTSTSWAKFSFFRALNGSSTFYKSLQVSLHKFNMESLSMKYDVVNFSDMGRYVMMR